MKRSEMVKKIYEELLYSKSPVHGIRTTNSPVDKKLAERIVKLIEESGMLPPPTNIEYGITTTLCYVNYNYLDMKNGKEQNLWEEE